ncbi:Txe/YoeB family addiction module toxin [Eisenbergiella sp.]|uniref:Txe/YoeB family addiction module toxin n=1 Tax=Eisenbergiella sp. TaxID=1924109 RepID=UPI00208A464C|nr:Txe/YoeB family addiction module toxin [Eisenbergiella sp.]BDF46484.1 hypothetical protein CE91St56_36070 [Lachnospiraceae bacterium]GKH42555.1 hypothetical protein CE91St57_35290 [Lachnospiraceae bacterium]
MESKGKPELLSGNLAGIWSRRINEKDRLVYKSDEGSVYVLSCRYHYSDKKLRNKKKHQQRKIKNVDASFYEIRYK